MKMHMYIMMASNNNNTHRVISTSHAHAVMFPL